VNEFVDQCRREWKRLGVRAAVADDMAAELAADLEEGVSPEEVLGSDAADARSFAATWASECGVIPRRTRNPRVIVPVAAAALALVALAGAVVMATASSRAGPQSVAAGPKNSPSPGPLPAPPEPVKSARVRVYDGPPFHVSYMKTQVFKERAIRVNLIPAVRQRQTACVDGVDFTATPCVWPASATDIATESSGVGSGVDWPSVGLGVTLFGGVGLILLASAWLWSRGRDSHHAMP
jgi:hypothetical protein